MEPLGVVQPLIRTRLCDISTFHHRPGRVHRDPAAEQTADPELVLTTQGRWQLRTARSSGVVTEDCLVALDSEQELQIRHDESEPRDAQVMISLGPALVDALRASHPRDNHLFDRSHCGMTPRIDAVRRLLLEELSQDRPGRTFAVDNLVSMLAVEALRTGATDRPRRYQGGLTAARDYLEAHLSDDLDLTVLATYAHVSPGHFTRLFKAEFGQTPRDYLLRSRIRRAAELIDAGVELPAVAARVGLHSPSHFRAAFRRYLGTAPSRWRTRGRP